MAENFVTNTDKKFNMHMVYQRQEKWELFAFYMCTEGSHFERGLWVGQEKVTKIFFSISRHFMVYGFKKSQELW